MPIITNRLGVFSGASLNLNVLITTPQTDFDVATYLTNHTRWNAGKRLNLTVTINSGVQITASSPATNAFSLQNIPSARSNITIINNGYIFGAGGSAGTGGYQANGHNGGNGGPAFFTSVPCKLINNGVIKGGGGGQGGDGGIIITTYYNCNPYTCSTGSGTGAVASQSTCGCGCYCCVNTTYNTCQCFTCTTCYQQCPSYTYNTGNAGAAGTLGGGAVGSNGVNANQYAVGTGGSYGLDINGYSKVTYSGSGSTAGHTGG